MSQHKQTIRQYIDDCRVRVLDNVGLGRRFEDLTSLVLTTFPEYEIKQVYRWSDWPDRREITGLGGNDIGIDLVAQHNDGYLIAIQCKCYGVHKKISKQDIDSFLATSQRKCFRQRWLVTVNDYTNNVQNQILGMDPPVKNVNLLAHGHRQVPVGGGRLNPESPMNSNKKLFNDL